MEKVGKHIRRYSSRPGLDVLRFFELTLFSFLTGNADMHLKNFSLLTAPVGELELTLLSPAYDLLNTKIAMPGDLEELALTLNAKKRKLKKIDFDIFARSLNIPERSVQRTYTRFSQKVNNAFAVLDISFLPSSMKTEYKNILDEMAGRMELQ